MVQCYLSPLAWRYENSICFSRNYLILPPMKVKVLSNESASTQSADVLCGVTQTSTKGSGGY